MNKLNIAIDVKKIQKSRLRDNNYTNKNGEDISQKFCDVVIIPLKEDQLIKECSNGSKMYKVGFVVEKGTKEEHTEILGDVIEFKEQNQNQQAPPVVAPIYPEEDINPEDIPF